MHKRIACFVSYILVAAFVIAVIYYNEDAKNKAKTLSRYMTLSRGSRSTCQSPPTSDSNNTNATWCVTGRPCTYPDVVDLRIIVITFNRADSLSKLLRSLDTLVLDGDRAALEIWIDRDRKNGVHQHTLEVASAFKWKGGSTRVHVQVTLCCLVLYMYLKRKYSYSTAAIVERPAFPRNN